MSFKLTWQSAQTSNLCQNRARIQSQPWIIVCLQKCIFSCILARAFQCVPTIPVKMHQTQTAIYLAVSQYNLHYLPVYQLSKWRQNDMSPIIQFPPLIGPFLLTSLSLTIANQQQSPLLLCLDHSNQEQKHDKSKCRAAVACLCGHVMGYKCTIGCLWGGRRRLNCHNFQRKASFISCPDSKY